MTTPRKITTTRIPLSKLVPFAANPPKRTDEEAADLQSLATHIANGGSIEPISVVRDEVNDLYRNTGGHRRAKASELAGLDSIVANVTHLRPGEDPEEVQRELFKNNNKNKPIVGKDHLYIALATDGEVVMSNSAKKNYGLIQAHFGTSASVKTFLMQHATTDLFRIALTLANLANNTDTNRGEPMSKSAYSLFFRQAVYFLVEFKNQRRIRDYIAGKTEMPKKLRKAIVTKTPFFEEAEEG